MLKKILFYNYIQKEKIEFEIKWSNMISYLSKTTYSGNIYQLINRIKEEKKKELILQLDKLIRLDLIYIKT